MNFKDYPRILIFVHKPYIFGISVDFMVKTLRMFISGTVSGPMYKKYIEDEANKIGVRGFVRDMGDGRVEVLAEGIDEKVNALVEVCRRGTQHVQIRGVDVIELKNQGFVGFKILRI